MKKISVIVMCIFIIFAATSPAYAHKMMITPKDGDIIKVSYGDGSTNENIRVILYDENDNEIHRDKVDKDGIYDYSQYPNAKHILADDSMGHTVKWTVGEPASHSGGIAWGKIFLILAVFIAVAVIFKNKQKNKPQTS